MALILNHELPTGESGNYWRLVSVSSDVTEGYSSAVLVLYKSKAKRDAGARPMAAAVQVRFTTGELNAVNTNGGQYTHHERYWRAHYLALKAMITQAAAIPPDERTAEQAQAMRLFGAQDD